jgi:adenylate cyclase
MLDSFWAKVKPFFWRARGVWIATPTVAGLVILFRLSGILQGWEWTTYDFYMRLRPTEERDLRIGIVGIDENDIKNLKESIIPDGTLADLLEKVKAMKPRAIGLDLYRDLSVPPGHEKLLKVFQTTPNLIGIQKVAGEVGRDTVAPSFLLKKLGQIGANDLPIDSDNRIRRSFFYLSDGKENVYGFGLHLAAHYLEKDGIAPQAIAGTENLQIGKAVFVPLKPTTGAIPGRIPEDFNS